MMRLGPIIKRDIEIKSRGMSLPVGMTVINAVLFAAALAMSFGEILSAKTSYSLNYAAFLDIFIIIVMFDYILMLFCAPIMTAGSISGERERGTFDLLLTTRLSAADIIIEKLVSALISMGTIIASGLPAILVPLMFGGVRIQSAVFLILLFMAGVFEILSLGMLAGSIGSSSVRSITAAYAGAACIVAGPLLIAAAAAAFSREGGNGAVYLLTVDPLFTVFSSVLRMTGRTQLLNELFLLLKASPDAGLIRHSVLIGTLIQVAAGFGLIMLSIIYTMPRSGGFLSGRKSDRAKSGDRAKSNDRAKSSDRVKNSDRPDNNRSQK